MRGKMFSITFCSSTLDVMLRKVQKRCDAVTVQLLTQCELFRELSFFKHEAHKVCHR